MSYNRSLLDGRLTKDPQGREVTVGGLRKRVVNFNLAVNGFRQDDTLFIRIVTWGKLAENCEKYLKKGARVFVDGRLEENRWTKDGVEQRTMQVVAQIVNFIDTRNNDEPTQRDIAPQPAGDADIPF